MGGVGSIGRVEHGTDREHWEGGALGLFFFLFHFGEGGVWQGGMGRVEHGTDGEHWEGGALGLFSFFSFVFGRVEHGRGGEHGEGGAWEGWGALGGWSMGRMGSIGRVEH